MAPSHDANAEPAGATAVPFDMALTIPVVRGTIDGIVGRLWQWRAYLREHAPGTRVALRIERAAAAPRDVAIQLAELVP